MRKINLYEKEDKVSFRSRSVYACFALKDNNIIKSSKSYIILKIGGDNYERE